MKKNLHIGKLQNYNRPIKNGKVKMGPTATFSSAVVIVQGRMNFYLFSYLSSISMLLDSSQTANPILTLYLSTLEGFDENTKLIQKQRQDLKTFSRLTFASTSLKCLFLLNKILRIRLCFKKLGLQK